MGGLGGLYAFKILVGKSFARVDLKDRREGGITLRQISERYVVITLRQFSERYVVITLRQFSERYVVKTLRQNSENYAVITLRQFSERNAVRVGAGGNDSE
jgi:hypothetical protein